MYDILLADIPMQVVTGTTGCRYSGVPTYAKIPDVNVITATPRDRLTLERELGQGAFGRVLLARARSIVKRGVVTPVAIKTLKGKGS